MAELDEAIAALDNAVDGRGVRSRLHIGPRTSEGLKATLRRHLAIAGQTGPVFTGLGSDVRDVRAEASYWDDLALLASAVAAALRAGV
jgi:hypothetical protein